MFGQGSNRGEWLRRTLIGAVAGLVLAGPAAAEWRRAESERFIVYSNGDVRELREYVQKLETYDRVMRMWMGLRMADAPPRKLPIYLVNSRHGLERVIPTVGENVAGVYIPAGEDIFAVAIREQGEDVLLHEYAHHFMMQNFSFGYPGWFVEGFAEYYMTMEIREGRVDVGEYNENRASWLVNGSWIPLEELLSKRPSELVRSNHRETYYPVAWLLTHWFMGDAGRRDQLQVYLQDVGDGGDPVEAMERATGLSLLELRNELRRYMRGRIPYVQIEHPFPTAEIVVTDLPASADDLLLLGQRLKIGVAEDQRAETAEMVRRAAARHGDDPFAQLTLGHAELHFGDAARGEELLNRLLEREPANVEALQLLATARMREVEDRPDEAAALMARARGYLSRAYRADDANYYTLYLIAQTRAGAAGYPNDNDMDTWLLAYSLAPQLAGIRLGAADALLRQERTDEAIGLLKPLANGPHSGGAGEQAQAMIDAAQLVQAAAGATDEAAAADAPTEEPAAP